ncbi:MULTISPECIES: chemoreceptor glutamine deamidase CheD [unclassified Motilimonas]|uniref:chemoreceptor glutamine deamidase CheD n=1 Tax=unclassified Motilimonas TaxID=2643697 RepID=UPI001E65CC59|nr:MULTISPECIES: chemoreceptor glutamine deamidase CheD [unclassified Motilimonas]MCE0555878.1 chemoreceptor glutamine deamidase CheD [Motilimonas sp. E26]MDO6524074.1 chemoreceptor glutamine deamidase CheD [Motilimonas sp. 1_MG-2023]
MFTFDVNNSHLAPNRYYDRHFDCDAVKILPGEYFATKHNTLIVTVLGSCVSVCLRDPLLGIAGMNHFLLPQDNSQQDSVLSESGRYGIYAMEILINHLLKLGAKKERLEAKVFGGGNVLKGFMTVNVGERNVEFVQDYLNTEQIPIIASDLLDIYPRKVYFFPDTGRVMVRKIKNLHNSTIIDRESEYRLKLRTQPESGEVELFND